MKELIIKRNYLILGVIIWWLVFATLSIVRFNNFQILNIVGFIFLAFIPGMLTVLSLRLKQLPFWANLSISVAFSLLELMIMGLVGNFILPKFGIVQPLAPNVLLIEMSILVSILSIIAWVRLSDWELNMGNKLCEIFPSKIDVWLSFFPVIFVIQSIIGAISLNNGGSGLWTLAMLGEIAIYVLVLYFYTEKIDDNTIPVALYFIGLALLLMTSLRGWYITGHDIQQEYKVFELTKNAGIWNMAFYRDAYNACLSITILPTIFFNLLGVSDPYIYKFFFQLLFALVPGIAYLISRHWADKCISFLAGFYFVAFHTFFIDMPSLVRQEIAFLFYGLMLYIIFEEKLSIRIRRLLFIIMGIGVVLSHYSTTYTILLIFALVVISRPIFIGLFNYFKKKWNLFSDSSLHNQSDSSSAKITLWMVVILFAINFLWTSVVTNTGGNITKVLKATVYAARDGLTENNRSTDAVNLVSFRKPDQQKDLENYIKNVINPIRKNAEPGVYFDESSYNQYPLMALPDERLPLTKLGIFVQKFSLNLPSLLISIERILIKLMEILIPTGLFYLLLRKNIIKNIDKEFYLIAVGALFFIFLIIVIPVLSTEYGIFRAMQQSMFVLAIPLVLGSAWIGESIEKIKSLLSRYYLKIRGVQIQSFPNKRGNVPIILVLLFFLYSSSLILQIFGNGPPQIYLSNAGRYYDNYLIKTSEIYGVDWLGSIIQNNDVSGLKIKIQTDRYSKARSASLSHLDAYNEILPAVVRKDAYVFLGQATTKKQRATVVYGGDQITYSYPVKFLDDNKNLIYNNGSAKIYR